MSNGGDATNSLVVVQQNCNEIKWRQRNLSVETVQWGAWCRNNCTLQPKLQIKCVFRQPCMLIWELCSLIYVANAYQIVNDLGPKLGQTYKIQRIQGAFERFSEYRSWKRWEYWYWGILVGIYFHRTDDAKGDMTGALNSTYLNAMLVIRTR